MKQNIIYYSVNVVKYRVYIIVTHTIMMFNVVLILAVGKYLKKAS